MSKEISLIMGSVSDWETMRHGASVLSDFGVSFERKIISAHRTPERLYEYAKSVRSKGIALIIAAAGGAAHLPGMVAAITDVPVLGVPIESRFMNGLDSLLSIVQMPAGIAVGCLSVGKSGAINAALLGISILSIEDLSLRKKLSRFRHKQTASVAIYPDD